MQYLVYILRSQSYPKTYVGHTNNLERRLNDHNKGYSLFSRNYRPWIVMYTETFNSLFEAIKREKYFKSAAGRRWMKKKLFDKINNDVSLDQGRV